MKMDCVKQMRKDLRKLRRNCFAERRVALLDSGNITWSVMEIYNVKTIQYENGIVEIRKYSRPIGDDGMESLGLTKEQIKKRAERGKKRVHDILDGEKVFNPFTEKVETMYCFNHEEILKERAVRSQRNSFRRTKNEIFNVSRQCKWRYFVTLTFSKAKVDRYSFSDCMKKANNWYANQRKRYAKDLQYIFVPEEHKDGAWHIHGLIAQCDGMKFTDSGLKTVEGQIIYNLDGWKNGWSTAVQIGTTQEDIMKVSTYITKYITKDLCAKTKGQRRYYRSQNIPKPIETIDLVEGNQDINYVDMVADSLGMDVTYTKTVKGYMDVNYIYLQRKEE